MWHSWQQNLKISVIPVILTAKYVTDDLNTAIFVISGSKAIVIIVLFLIFLKFCVQRFFRYFRRPYWIKSFNKKSWVAILYKRMSWIKNRPSLKKIKQKLKTWECRSGKQQKSCYDVIKAKFSISEEKHIFF